MDISLLPGEVLEEILFFLNIDDILSCCLVSPRWRNAINRNNVWFKLCAKKFKVSRNNVELISTPCEIEPTFSLPKQLCESLTQICPWRLRFMQEAHISRNWRYGRFTAKEITSTVEPHYIECDDDVLVILSLEKRSFTTITIDTFPVVTQTSVFSLWHVLSDFFKLCNGRLVVVQCTLLQVYVKSPEHTFDLACRVLFNKNEQESNNIPNTKDISDWYNNNVGLYPSDLNTVCDHNGTHFVGLVHPSNLNKAIIHIWDICSGHKAIAQRVPDTCNRISDIHFSIHNSNLHILLKLEDQFKEFTSIYCYDLNTFKYTNFLLRFDYVVPIVIFGEKYLVNSDYSQKNLWLWKTEDASFVHKINCNSNIHPTSLQLINSYIIFAGNIEFSGLVKIFDIGTLEIICEFVVGFRVTNLLLVRTNMILVGGPMHLGLWDINTGTKLQALYFLDCLWINSNYTKTVVQNEDDLFLLQFW